MSRLLFVSALLAASAFPLAVRAAPAVEVQNLKWIVVQELPGTLAEYHPLIDAAMPYARRMLQGDQGAADVPCCVDVRRTSIQELSASSLVTIDGEFDFDTMTLLCQGIGGGSCAFLVSSIPWCGGPGAGIVGCADAPACNQNLPNDDPTLVMAVSLDALDGDLFAQTIAHERGHNACLDHVPSAENPTDNRCNLMQGQAGGGCLNAVECGHYRNAGNAEQGTCGCHTDVQTVVADGAACSDVASGICSGGVCGATPEASVQLLAAGGPEAAAGAVTDDPLRVAALAGGWTDLGGFGGNAVLRGLEAAPSRGAIYGVTQADELIRVDPATGMRLATIGALPATGSFSLPPGGSQAALYESLAFDPGPTAGAGDDLLWSIRISESCPDDEFCDVELVSIDPDDAATTVRGPLTALYPGTRHGLGFDAVRGRLYSTIGFGGLSEVDTACTGTPGCFGCCEATDTGLDLVFSDAALAYEATTDQLYAIGTDLFGGVAFVVIDAAAQPLAALEPIGIDAFTPGALAAPEPGAAALGAAVAAALTSLSSRRSPRRRRRAARRSC
jgi:hypothetical protein